MKKLSLQAFLLLLCFTSVFLWEKSGYTDYTIHVISVLSVLYVLSNKMRRKKLKDESKNYEFPTVVLLLLSVLLLIGLTGAIHSLFFFLLYFLLFYLACMLTPGVVFFFAALACFLYLGNYQQNELTDLVKIYALLLFTPLAYFLGRNVQDRQTLQKEEQALETKIEGGGKKIMADVAEIVKTEGNKLDDKTLSRLKDIVDTSRTLQKEKKND